MTPSSWYATFVWLCRTANLVTRASQSNYTIRTRECSSSRFSRRHSSSFRVLLPLIFSPCLSLSRVPLLSPQIARLNSLNFLHTPRADNRPSRAFLRGSAKTRAETTARRQSGLSSSSAGNFDSAARVRANERRGESDKKAARPSKSRSRVIRERCERGWASMSTTMMMMMRSLPLPSSSGRVVTIARAATDAPCDSRNSSWKCHYIPPVCLMGLSLSLFLPRCGSQSVFGFATTGFDANRSTVTSSVPERGEKREPRSDY